MKRILGARRMANARLRSWRGHSSNGCSPRAYLMCLTRLVEMRQLRVILN
jgi:hypothetical protein